MLGREREKMRRGMSLTTHFTYHNSTSKNDKTNQISKCFFSAMDVSPTYHPLTFVEITHNTFHDSKRIKIEHTQQRISLSFSHSHPRISLF
jgi:hypothetical protein